MINQDKKFLIVGLGLLGGSYAKGLKEKGYSVYALDINQDSIQFALEQGIIDSCYSEHECIENADYIIFGLYPTLIKPWLIEHQHLIKKSAILTDVSGVKRVIVPEIQACLKKDIEFIASHPMAGKEVSGVQSSDNHMFKQANFIITPTDINTKEAIAFLEDLGKTLEFNRISVCTLDEHDKMIGYVSQLTHVIAVSLMNAQDNTHLVQYTGDSFRDLTRIAKINENLWSELFLLNKDYLIQEIEDFIKELNHFKDTLYNDDEEEMKRLFIQSTKRRKQFDK